MRLKKRILFAVCQNCKHSNNNKGKFINTWKRKGVKLGLDKDDNFIKIPNKGFWHIYCEKRKKFYPWDYRKKCIEIRDIFKRNMNNV